VSCFEQDVNIHQLTNTPKNYVCRKCLIDGYPAKKFQFCTSDSCGNCNTPCGSDNSNCVLYLVCMAQKSDGKKCLTLNEIVSSKCLRGLGGCERTLPEGKLDDERTVLPGDIWMVKEPCMPSYASTGWHCRRCGFENSVGAAQCCTTGCIGKREGIDGLRILKVG
jgi:hypothetical protein